jgi:hypothetical protein
MNLLADENVERIVVTWLRAEGHDIRSLSLATPDSASVRFPRPTHDFWGGKTSYFFTTRLSLRRVNHGRL